MKRLVTEISIGAYVFSYTNNIEIAETWQDFTVKGTLTLPARLRLNGETIFAGDGALIKRGDAITIKVGYFPTLTEVFTGFVTKVYPGRPVVVEFEDFFFKLKQTNFTKTLKNVTLAELISFVAPDYDFEAVDANLGTFRISRASAVQVFEELRKNYGLYTWGRGGKIYSGLAYRPALRETHDIEFERVVINREDLFYQNADDVLIKVVAVSIYPDNKKATIEVGDPEGEVRTLNFYNVPAADLKARAEAEIGRLKYSGFVGSFETFGEPIIHHGDEVRFSSKKTPELDGSYLVDKVERTHGVNGSRQIVTLGPKL